MSRQRSDEEIQVLLHAHISARDFPSAVYLVAERGQVIFEKALGDAVREPVQVRAETETIYDLASLTKPLVTGLLCAKLSDRGVMNFDHEIARYLPEFARNDKRSITIKQLLTHTSGLAPWLPLRALTNDVRERALEVIASHSLSAEGNSRVVYSDLGFIILGFLLERLTNSLFAALADAEIFTPLGLRNTYFNPPRARRPHIAASETGNVYEDEMARRDYLTAATSGRVRREEVIWGEVHDGNAYFLGGAARPCGPLLECIGNAAPSRAIHCGAN
ncbi:MAG: serine hydrolase domain-containing protein [Pyrinomonadaceae bacterium]